MQNLARNKFALSQTWYCIHVNHKLNKYDKELFNLCLNFFANPKFSFANPGQNEQRDAGKV